MNKKGKYTLYFKGINDYEEEVVMPIINLSLKDMDKFTTNYEDEASLYKCLPTGIKKYIKNNLSYGINLEDKEVMKDRFFVTDQNGKKETIIYFADCDVTYITQKELIKLIINEIINKDELQRIFMNRFNKNLKLKYDFFKTIYNEFVKDRDIEKMVDTYEVEKIYSKYDKEKILISSIASDKDNIIVVATKIAQTNEGKRTLALLFKDTFIKLYNKRYIEDEKIKDRFNGNLNVFDLKENMLNNLKAFKERF